MENKLNFKRKKSRFLCLQTFENWTPSHTSVSGTRIRMKDTRDQIHKMVIDVENKKRGYHFASKRRELVYLYWVEEYEEIIDDRKKFGHENKSSTKKLRDVTPIIYVRGEITTLKEAQKMSSDGKFSEDTKARLWNIINDLGFDNEKLSKKQLKTKIVMIPGEGKRETFFEQISRKVIVRNFLEEELNPLHED